MFASKRWSGCVTSACSTQLTTHTVVRAGRRSGRRARAARAWGYRVGASLIRQPTRSRMDRTLAPVPQASDFAPHGCAGGSGGDEAPLGRARPLEGALTRVVGRLALVLLGVAAGLATAETALRLFPVGHAAQQRR